MRWIFLTVLLSSCTAPSPYPISDHYDGERFHNTPPSPPKSIWHVLNWRLFGKRGVWEGNRVLAKPINIIDKNCEKKITFINHASFLLEFDGLNILTDPIWSERASPVNFAGPKRAYDPPIPIEKLPKIHVVLISHNHYDHLDVDTLLKLQKRDQPSFLLPLGDKVWLEKKGLNNVIELDWWEQHKFGDVDITFTPAKHWSARGLFDRNRSLWGGFVVEIRNKKIYFAGDTGYGKHFKEIFDRYKKIDVALLPIGAYEPREFMQEQHLNPWEAVQAHLDLSSHFSFGMHFGTFQLADENQDAPLIELKKALEHYKLSDNHFKAPLPLEEYCIPR
jgi:L-ascorbate metabolism protein UlaG (beta-lactamase superfamily)